MVPNDKLIEREFNSDRAVYATVMPDRSILYTMFPIPKKHKPLYTFRVTKKRVYKTVEDVMRTAFTEKVYRCFILELENAIGPTETKDWISRIPEDMCLESPSDILKAAIIFHRSALGEKFWENQLFKLIHNENSENNSI